MIIAWLLRLFSGPASCDGHLCALLTIPTILLCFCAHRFCTTPTYTHTVINISSSPCLCPVSLRREDMEYVQMSGAGPSVTCFRSSQPVVLIGKDR